MVRIQMLENRGTQKRGESFLKNTAAFRGSEVPSSVLNQNNLSSLIKDSDSNDASFSRAGMPGTMERRKQSVGFSGTPNRLQGKLPGSIQTRNIN